MAVAFLGKLWKELLWVFSPNKYGDVQIRYVDYWNLLYPVPMAIGLLSLRYVSTRYCFIPLGQRLGMKRSQSALTPDPALEEIYRKNLSRTQILGAAKQLDMSEKQVERWLRRRRRQDRPSVLTKLSECCWRFTYYSSIFLYGIVVLWGKPWLWDITKTWDGFPNAIQITNDIWWYYMISLSFYWSLLISQFRVDTRRSDFWQMFVHHLSAILLINFSWLARVYKIGTLVLVVHDCGDIFIEASKIAKYVNYNKTCTVLFCICTVVWIVTRVMIYPFWIVKHTLVDSVRLSPNFEAYYIFNGLLILLLMLHCFWTYLIAKIGVAALKAGGVDRDIRSSSESSGDE